MRRSAKKPWRASTWFRLLLAGWRSNRDVWHALALPQGFSIFSEAKKALSEFGNLKFGTPRDYVATDPSIGGEALAEEIGLCEQRFGMRLYPVGAWCADDTHYLVIDENGHVYTLISDRTHGRLEVCELEPLASSFDRAIEFLLRRHKKGARSEVAEDLRVHGIDGSPHRCSPSDPEKD